MKTVNPMLATAVKPQFERAVDHPNATPDKWHQAAPHTLLRGFPTTQGLMPGRNLPILWGDPLAPGGEPAAQRMSEEP